MSALLPSPLDYIGRRCFVFYPAIRGADPNLWVLGSGSRAEILVINAETKLEVWIPRRYIGAVSDSFQRDAFGPLTVGLRRELFFADGTVKPRKRAVIEIPLPENEPLPKATKDFPPGHHAPIVEIRLAERRKSPLNKAVVGLAISALLAWLLWGFESKGNQPAAPCAATACR